MTVILVSKDKKHLTKICFTDDIEVLIDNDVCIENGLCEGMNLDLEELEKIKFESEYKRAKSRALWYLDRMDYTEKKLFEKLTLAGFDKKASAKVLSNLTEFGLIDDRRFAIRYAERLLESNVSKRQALGKLYQKGVPYDLAKEVLESQEVDAISQLEELIAKKYASKLTTENGTQKVFAALIRRGFSFGDVKTALKKYNEELEFCEE